MVRQKSGAGSKASYYARGAGRESISGLSVIKLVLLPYLDPGSGSFLIQILIAAVLGGVVSVGLWFRRILGIFRRPSGGSQTNNGLEDPDLDGAGREGGKEPDGVGGR